MFTRGYNQPGIINSLQTRLRLQVTDAQRFHFSKYNQTIACMQPTVCKSVSVMCIDIGQNVISQAYVQLSLFYSRLDSSSAASRSRCVDLFCLTSLNQYVDKTIIILITFSQRPFYRNKRLNENVVHRIDLRSYAPLLSPYAVEFNTNTKQTKGKGLKSCIPPLTGQQRFTM